MSNGEQPWAFHPERPRQEIARVLRRRRRLRAGIVQLLYALVALALGLTLPHVAIGFQLPSSRAVEMLVAIGAGMVTFIGVVFSLLFLVVQFGSTTFTPRLNLFRDAPIVWHAFALFTGVIVYSFTAAFVIGRSQNTTGFALIVALILVLASIAVYRALQMGAFKSIQLASTLAQVADRGRVVIDGLYTQPARASDEPARPDEAGPSLTAGAGRHEIRWLRPSAILQVIDVPRVVVAMQRADAVLEFSVAPGERIPEGGVIAVAFGGSGSDLEKEVLKSLTVGEERTFEQDPTLAVRVLADIALRALSQGVNDPTTAVQALDASDSLLRVLATRELQIERVRARDGVVRVQLVLPSWDDYVATAVDELMWLPYLSPSVSRRIAKLLRDLASLAPDDRQPALTARLRVLDHPDTGSKPALSTTASRS